MSAAAVGLILIPPIKNEIYWRLIFIKRSTTIRSHKGQVGFAGGRIDPQDISPKDTAAREIEEEIGLSSSKLKAICQLKNEKSIDGSTVVPILFLYHGNESDFHLNPKEVESALALPWTHFTSTNKSSFTFNMFGIWRHSYLFQVSKLQVWGLTAKIIANANFIG